MNANKLTLIIQAVSIAVFWIAFAGIVDLPSLVFLAFGLFAWGMRLGLSLGGER